MAYLERNGNQLLEVISPQHNVDLFPMFRTLATIMNLEVGDWEQ